MQLDFAIKRPPLRYHGSKFRISSWIVPFFPEHVTYVEPYGGGAGVLLRKARSKIEIYNDIDSDVVNLFRVLRSDKAETLARMVALTPFSREEYQAALEPIDDPVERARRLVARSCFGFGSFSHNLQDRTNGFRTWHWDGNHHYKSYAYEWAGMPEALLATAKRLEGVTIEHVPAQELFPRYDHVQTLFYCDPPYVHKTRDDRHKGYRFEMCDEDHRVLAWTLKRMKGKVVISGYESRLYAELFKDWHKETKATMANGQMGAAARLECLWDELRATESDRSLIRL